MYFADAAYIPRDSNRALELLSLCHYQQCLFFPSYLLIETAITDGITQYLRLQAKYIDYLLATAPPSIMSSKLNYFNQSLLVVSITI
jgi:hypothetical protein